MQHFDARGDLTTPEPAGGAYYAFQDQETNFYRDDKSGKGTGGEGVEGMEVGRRG